MQLSQNTNYDITVVILAGGSSRRMHGRDKGMLSLHGKPLIGHVIERISTQTDKLVLSCNENCDNYKPFGYPIIADSLPGKLGPLAGLLSAIENNDSNFILCLPCDTPYLPRDLLARMYQSLRENKADICSVYDGKRLHPVILLVSRTLSDDLREYLSSGGRKARDWFERQHHCAADFSDQPNAFANINTMEQLQAEETS